MINYIDKKSITNMKSHAPKAVPLVTYSDARGYSLHPDGLEALRMLPQQDNYAVLSIVGKSKTGKSFLLNQLLEDNAMFPVSSHLGNCTKGLMIATKFMEVDNMKVLIIDAEGFGSIEGSDDRDCKLFILSILLSTVVVYNSLGTIDEQTLNNLSMIIEVGKLFEKELSNKKSIPALLWALRDFSLQLQDKNGYPISPSEYLENSLDEQKGSSQTINHKNRIRRVIKALFTERNCQTLVLPNDELSFGHTGEEALRPEFIQDVGRFKKKLWGMIGKKGVKEFCQQKMSISSFISAMQVYVNGFNRSLVDGSIPKIENLTFQLRENQAKGLKERFQSFLEGNKTAVIERMAQLANSGNGVDEAQRNEVFQPIEQFYVSTRNNLYQLTGSYQEEQLEAFKATFYESVERELESILMQNEELKTERSTPEVEVFNLCEYFSHILDEGELDHEYSAEMHRLKLRSIKADQSLFANMLMKLELAYLRRKVELCKEHNLQAERVAIELEYAKKEIQRLEARNRELEEGVVRSSRNSYATPNKTENYNSKEDGRHMSTFGKEPGHIRSVAKPSQSVKPLEAWKNSSASKIESSSLYVPYVLIHKSEYLSSKIVRTLIKEDSKRNNYIEYVIDVSLQGQKWSLNRKFKDFSELYSILIMMFQDERLPECKSIVGPLKLNDSNANRKEIVEQRRRELENYLCELIQNECIRNSRILQKFLKINKQYTVL